jgi:hypothetical protein
MQAQKGSRGIAILSPTLGATDSLQLMSEEELFFPGFITQSHIHTRLREKLTSMINAIHFCHFTLKSCSVLFSSIMTMIPSHAQMSCSHFSIGCCYYTDNEQ